MTNAGATIENYELIDRYDPNRERVYLTGTQAIVRILLDQARRDRTNGLHTGGFVSGYRGSPLGGLDQELWRQKKLLSEHVIDFLPAVNEDMAATALMGTQQVETAIAPKKRVNSVFGMWYGKGPGIDRSGDALKHANIYGSSQNGGVLVVAGDDHGCVSSSTPHQSDYAFAAWFMPVLAPASVADYLEFGEYGYALSRFSGMWVGFKAISEVVESARSVTVKPDRKFVEPDFATPPTGLHYRWPDLPGRQLEDRMDAKLSAVQAFAEANPIDRKTVSNGGTSLGIVASGKAYLDLVEALRLLDLGPDALDAFGIEIYKIGMVWPLAKKGVLDFIRGKREILVVEEKRGIVESQVKEYSLNLANDAPLKIIGKTDETGQQLIPWTGELSPRQLARALAKRLDRLVPGNNFGERVNALDDGATIVPIFEGALRRPFFCSGCPHNTSTRVPEGSKALTGVGCHTMASWMERKTETLVQMGGEGVLWSGMSRFLDNDHIFQNIGEGTWYHSGSLAIRQSVAAKTNITYKILFNDAVAMTGGQPVDGPVSVKGIAEVCRAEGVERIALVSDEPEKLDLSEFPKGVTLNHRRDMDRIQQELRDTPGVTVIIYVQTCATEKRRRRKRGTLEDPKRFVLINELVCEGCGDCSIESNCLSIEPLDTEFGRKRAINLSTCNKDFSCLNGFCPSFVTLEGAVRKKPEIAGVDMRALGEGLPLPKLPTLKDKPFNLLVTGVGGTGVVTIGAIISMAAHLEGLGTSVLDFTGFAQKYGSVLSYVRFAQTPDELNQVRIDSGSADAVVACDAVVSSSPQASTCYRDGSFVVLNTEPMPTAALVNDRDHDVEVRARTRAIAKRVGEKNVETVDASKIAEALLGDIVFANMLMLGYVWQKGQVPVELDAILRAIELNGVAIEKNKSAFLFGRVMATDKDVLTNLLPAPVPAADDLETVLKRRSSYLTEYQNAAWGMSYEARLKPILDKARELGRDDIAIAAAKSLFKLMSYKDEYEVARLHSAQRFKDRLDEQFEPGYNIKFHLAPPLLSSKLDARGRPRKREFGGYMRPVFAALARLRGLRGTAFDPFGHTAERKSERAVIEWYSALLVRAVQDIGPKNANIWLAILKAPMEIRGYGPVKGEAMEKIKQRVEDTLSTTAAGTNEAA
jgi:indolepyruvate ferredoxin oxidoreductase